MTTGTNRISWIDTAKGIGLLCVILGHLGVPYLAGWVYTFHMPLFFFLSGVVFSGEKYCFKDYLIRKIKTLVLPYFTLGFAIFLFFGVVYFVQGMPASAYAEMLKNFLVQEHYWTVWFLACLFLVEILYYIMYMLAGKKPVAATLISLAVCVFGLLRYRLGWGSLPWNLDVALVAQFFFHAGHLLKNRLLQIEGMLPKGFVKRAAIACVLFLVNGAAGFLCIRLSGKSLDMSIGMYGNELLTFVSAFAGILLIILVSQSVQSKYLTYLGRNTMIIFAWHSRIVIVLCGYVYDYFGIFQTQDIISQLLYAAVTFAVVLGVLVPLTEVIKRSRFHSLFGV